MNRLSELFVKLKLSVAETKGLDVGAVEAIISSLQANNGEEISCQICAIEWPPFIILKIRG